MNREAWLEKGVEELNALVFSVYGESADNVRVSVGFPAGSRGAKNSAIGQCWDTSVSAGGFNEIFISPTIEDSVKALDILAHEMVHAIVGTKAGHKGPFKRLATSIGLTGKMTATVAGPELTKTLESIVDNIGEYVHKKMSPGEKAKKKGSRLVKVVCTDCDNVARQALSTFDKYGLKCGSCDVSMVISS
tara:strand:+ start:1813 stop:2382 length:570 start_codon:yes stop_codon:yes gene_type:complete